MRRNITVGQALRAVADEAQVNVLVDVRVEKKTRARLVGCLPWMEVHESLEMLADMAGLVVVKRSNVYYVTSPANAERQKKVSWSTAHGRTQSLGKDEPPAASTGRGPGTIPSPSRRQRP
jgi:type II secretory pathway component HofQ